MRYAKNENKNLKYKIASNGKMIYHKEYENKNKKIRKLNNLKKILNINRKILIKKFKRITNTEQLGKIFCDIPKHIISIKHVELKTECLIDWNVRYNGSKPIPSYVSLKKIKSNFPQILINYYENLI